MQLFAKRFWGFDPSRWPIISFSLPGNRDALVRASNPGDCMVFVGTKTEETEPAERGRLLGMAEIGRIPIESEDVLDLSSLKPSAFDQNGKIRWPKALPMVRAWRFLNPPLVEDILQRQLSYEATTRAVLLNAVDTEAVLSIARQEVNVPETTAIMQQRRLNDVLSASRATTGPRPTSWTAAVTRHAQGPAYTYAFQFGTRDHWKIGHSTDVQARLVEVNKHIPHEVLGEQWRLSLEQWRPTENAAYEMEQRVLAGLRTPSCVGERVSCTRRKLESVWSSLVRSIARSGAGFGETN